MNRESLSLCLFGSHLLRCGSRPHHFGIRGKTLELLQYLVIHAGQEQRREFIADQIWCDSSASRQRSALNSAIWRINKQLVEYSGLNLQLTGSSICLDIDESVTIDTNLLTELVRRGECGMGSELTEQLCHVLEACEKPFLNGLIPDWALPEQERIFNIRLRGLSLLMHWYGDNRRYEDALEVGRRLLTKDPFRETVQIDMMWLYVLNGQRAWALKQYKNYAAFLESELAIEPMAEMQALYDYIQHGMNANPLQDEMNTIQFNDPATQKNKLDAILESVELSRREIYYSLRTQLGSV